jgi:AcrR family transcriptional regulator
VSGESQVSPTETPRRPRLKSAHRRKQIAQACIDVISEQGFSSTSIRDIASRADISIGTLLHHFASKDEVFLLSLEQVMNTWLNRAEVILRGEGSAEERLRRMIAWVFEPEYAYLWRVWIAFMHESAFDHDRLVSVTAATEAWDTLVASAIEEAVDQGAATGDPVQLAKELGTAMNGVAVDLIGRFGRWNQETGVDFCCSILFARTSE